MKILSMTATFGKLAHETLTLKPGLNVIQAPNEWGKSTWCAFMEAMLYGIDTRERTTQTSLAAKERYAPWSGTPMSGRMDILWNGKNITLERRTKGRSIFGDFKAYETDTGLPVAELTGANCGEQLLGIERSVFTRTAFLKLSNLPVDEDEALRSRLNGLVTTGDESGQADALAGKLRALKNRCKHNKTGLLPEAETQREQLRARLSQLQALQEQTQQLRQRQAQLQEQEKLLLNHSQALAYAANLQQTQKLEAAKLAKSNAEETLEQLEKNCAALPDKAQAEAAMTQLRQLRGNWDDLAMELQLLPQDPLPPELPQQYAGLSGEEILRFARTDHQVYAQSRQEAKTDAKAWLPLLLIPAGILLLLIPHWTGIAAGVVALLAAIGLYASGAAARKRASATVKALEERHSPLKPEQWLQAAQKIVDAQVAYEQAVAQNRSRRTELETRRAELKQKIDAATQGKSFAQWEDQWRSVEQQLAQLEQARAECRRAQELVKAMDGTAATVQPPQFPDTLTYSQQQTEQLLEQIRQQKWQLQSNLGQTQGQMESIGSREQLEQQLKAIDARIEQLEDTYAALTIAQQTLSDASNALQRRFAPRISQRAQSLFGKLTGSRYDRLLLEQDLSVSVGAQGEDTLHKSQWRSDGTVDQMYLALRLAVAEELAPHAPMILDDALVRFDDTRLASALALLREVAKSKQVLLFTCQTREQKLLEGE